MCPPHHGLCSALGRASRPSLAWGKDRAWLGLDEVSGEQDQALSPQGPSSATRAHVTCSTGIPHCWEGGRDVPKNGFATPALKTPKPSPSRPLPHSLPVQPQMLPHSSAPPPKPITATAVTDPKSPPYTNCHLCHLHCDPLSVTAPLFPPVTPKPRQPLPPGHCHSSPPSDRHLTCPQVSVPQQRPRLPTQLSPTVTASSKPPTDCPSGSLPPQLPPPRNRPPSSAPRGPPVPAVPGSAPPHQLEAVADAGAGRPAGSLPEGWRWSPVTGVLRAGVEAELAQPRPLLAPLLPPQPPQGPARHRPRPLRACAPTAPARPPCTGPAPSALRRPIG